MAIPLLLSGLLGGCGDERITGPTDAVDVRPHVTGAAAANLGADLLFSYPVPVAPSTEPIISAERARELAVSFALTFGTTMERKWTREHGRAFDPTELQADSRVFYQSSTFELFPDGYHGAMRRAFGPFYLVRLSSRGTHRLKVAVSAYNTNLAIFPDGTLNRPLESGMDFVENGVPLDTARRDVMSPLSPEAAVVRVSRLTGLRVSEVPELVQIGWRWGPVGGGWKITLEQPVAVRTLSGTRTANVRELYLGRERGRLLLIPTAEQPTEYETLAFGPAGSDEVEVLRLPILPGQPTVFEEVEIVSAAN